MPVNLTIISHKPCWKSEISPTGYETDGGFPFQIKSVSELFDATTLIIPLEPSAKPNGTISITGKNISVISLKMPRWQNFARKIHLFLLLPKIIPILWREIKKSDAVHTPVPGDIGFLGLILALIQKKPLFVRHCGTWGNRATIADRALHFLLERIAGGENIVFATGGGKGQPSKKNQNISWIFSTTLYDSEIEKINLAQPWKTGDTLKLIFIGRLTKEKNVQSAIKAIPILKESIPSVELTVVGGGNYRAELIKIAEKLNLTNQINFTGNLSHDQIFQQHGKSHLFVFPTNVKEGFPKVVIEAMAAGLPVITTNVSVLPFLIGTENGIILESPTPQNVSDAILQIISDERKYHEMMKSARETALKYTLENWKNVIAEKLSKHWSGFARND